MRVLLQVVSSASVTIDEKLFSSIGRGFCLFVGFQKGDDLTTLTRMADKVCHLRIFPDENGKTNKSLHDVDGALLSVSQFTLYANTKEGNRPSFIDALPGKDAAPLYALWNNLLLERVKEVKTGVFGADMQVKITNEGPFTLWLDSKELF